MGSIVRYGTILLAADAILIAGFGLMVILLPRRSTDGRRIALPVLPIMGAVIIAEIAVGLIYLGIMLVAGHISHTY